MKAGISCRFIILWLWGGELYIESEYFFVMRVTVASYRFLTHVGLALFIILIYLSP